DTLLFPYTTLFRSVYMLAMDGSRRVEPLVETDFDDRSGVVSPDGGWLAYDWNITGQLEVHVRPFPNVGSGHWVVSTSGGAWPLWSGNGRELFYIAPTGTMMSTPIEQSATWKAGNPTRL